MPPGRYSISGNNKMFLCAARVMRLYNCLLKFDCYKLLLLQRVSVHKVAGQVEERNETSAYLGKVGDDFSAFHPGIVILVNQQRLYDHQNLVNEGPHQFIQLVQNPVDDLQQNTNLE